VTFRVTREGESVSFEVRLLVSPGALDTRKAARIQLFAPLYHWTNFAGVSASRLEAMIEKSLEVSPSRFYVLEDDKKVSAWVGLQRTIDNRSIRPIHVRRQLEALFADVKASESVWNGELWK